MFSCGSQADRGEDIGVLLSCAPLSEFAALSARSTAGGARVHHNEKRLLRIATQVRSITIQLFFGIIACILLSFFFHLASQDEVDQLVEKSRVEEQACEYITNLFVVAQSMLS